MRAGRLHGVRDVRLDQIDAPPEPGPDEAAVAPLWCGLCGTDVKAYLDPPVTLGGAGLPLIVGHEFSARVVAAGARVRHVQPGDAVAIMPLRHCGACGLCRRGEFSLCPNKRWTGLGAEWGSLADCALVAGYQLSPLAGVPAETGALLEPAAVAMNAVQRAGVRPGDAVLVMGCGPVRHSGRGWAPALPAGAGPGPPQPAGGLSPRPGQGLGRRAGDDDPESGGAGRNRLGGQGR